MAAPRLKDPTWQRRASDDAIRTVTPRAPHRPISGYHSVRWWQLHHMTRKDDGEWRDESGWAGQRSTVPARRRRVSYRERQRDLERDVYTTARHAQELREENAEAHRAGSRERADFYGTGAGSYDPRNAERRVTGGGTASREAYEREQADAYAAARRRRGEAALRRARAKGRTR